MSEIKTYQSSAFLEVMRNDPKLGLQISFVADMMAGRIFGADVHRCRSINWKTVLNHKLCKTLTTELTNFWRQALKGISIVRTPNCGQGLIISDLQKFMNRQGPLGIALTYSSTVSEKDACCVNISIGGGRKINPVWIHGPLRLVNHQTKAPFRTIVSGVIKRLYYVMDLEAVDYFDASAQLSWDYFQNASEEDVLQNFRRWNAFMCQNVREKDDGTELDSCPDVSLVFTPKSLKRLRSETYAASVESSSKGSTVVGEASTSGTGDACTSGTGDASTSGTGQASTSSSSDLAGGRSISPDLFAEEEADTVTVPGILPVPISKIPDSTWVRITLHNHVSVGFKKHCILCNNPAIDSKTARNRHFAKFHRKLLGTNSSEEYLVEAMRRASVLDSFLDYTNRENVKVVLLKDLMCKSSGGSVTEKLQQLEDERCEFSLLPIVLRDGQPVPVVPGLKLTKAEVTLDRPLEPYINRTLEVSCNFKKVTARELEDSFCEGRILALKYVAQNHPCPPHKQVGCRFCLTVKGLKKVEELKLFPLSENP